MAAKRSEAETFEQMLERAEAIARELEEGSLSLDESLKRYEEGVKALKGCYTLLREAEKRIEVLIKDSEGNLRTAPFESQAEGSRESASPDDQAGSP